MELEIELAVCKAIALMSAGVDSPRLRYAGRPSLLQAKKKVKLLFFNPYSQFWICKVKLKPATGW